jgi:hypothetical protein
MACPDVTTHRFTITMRTDPENGRVFVEEDLFFCLVIPDLPIDEDTYITGIIDGLPDPVTGKLMLTGQTDVYIIILEFNWDTSHILMVGCIYQESGTRFEFVGRFFASERTDGFSPGGDEGVRTNMVNGPDPGDTGTGTGQQT